MLFVIEKTIKLYKYSFVILKVSHYETRMPRKPVIRSNHHYYHLVARVNNKENFYVPLDQVWITMIHELSKLQKEFDLKLVAFVLMSNHFHLLALSPKEDIDKVMYFFMKNITRNLQKKSGRINRIFGGRYKGCLIEDHQYLLNVYKYIHRNPVAAGVVSHVENYEYSTLFYEISKGPLKIAIEPFLQTDQKVLEWLNGSYSEKEAMSIKYGLSRSSFEYLKNRGKRNKIIPVI